MTLRTIDGAILVVDGALAMSAACCCDCGGCCTDVDRPGASIVDFGAGGLTDTTTRCTGGWFTNCVDIAGEWELSSFGDGCQWEITATPACFPFPPDDVLRILLEIRRSGGGCFHRVTVTLTDSVDDEIEIGSAVYETTPGVFVENDCTLASAVTLTKVSEDWSVWCGGSLPNTITIKAAP